MNSEFESRSLQVSESVRSCLPNNSHSSTNHASSVRVFVVVEGTNDIKFLKRISAILHTSNATLPNLARWEQQGKLIFVPTGGDLLSWSDRRAPLHKPEFHICDREMAPETELRQKAAVCVNRRPDCRAVLTNKRSIENYLHPRALVEAGGPELLIDDFDSVPEQVARQRFAASEPDTTWECLSRRSRKRCCYYAKRWLNTSAVERMTPELLAARDPDGEVVSWLESIHELATSGC